MNVFNTFATAFLYGYLVYLFVLEIPDEGTHEKIVDDLNKKIDIIIMHEFSVILYQSKIYTTVFLFLLFSWWSFARIFFRCKAKHESLGA